LGKELDRVFGAFLDRAKDIKGLIETVRYPLLDNLVKQGIPAGEAIKWIDEQLYVSESELQRCAARDPDEDSHLAETDVELALKEGYFEMRDQRIRGNHWFSDRAIEVLDKAMYFLLREYPSTAQDLIDEAKKLLNIGKDCTACKSFCQQLARWINELEAKPDDPAFASATATSLGALADCLHNHLVIGDEERDQTRNVCWRFFARA
jgi:uncharacterized protein YoaH (UPF0181 family)